MNNLRKINIDDIQPGYTLGHADAAILRDELRELLSCREAQGKAVTWGSPKTVSQLIGQLQTFDRDMEVTSVLRMKNYDGEYSGKIRQCPISISWERYEGHWMIPYKDESKGRLVLTFWAKPDDRDDSDRGEYIAAPQPPAAPDGWIPVSERLPDSDDFVLIWPLPDFGVELHAGQYMRHHRKDPDWFAQVNEQNHGIEFYRINVTHWMPLPAAPKPE